MKIHRINQAQLDDYLNCSIIPEFKSYKETDKECPIEEEIIRVILDRFVKNSGSPPDFSLITKAWDYRFNRDNIKRDIGVKLIIAGKKFYELFSKTGITLFDSDIYIETGYYREKIDYLGYDRYNDSLIPLFLNISNRSNKARFTSSILSKDLCQSIYRYATVDTSKLSISVNNFNHDELFRAEKELDDLLMMINNGMRIPNTSLCSNCIFKKECKI